MLEQIAKVFPQAIACSVQGISNSYFGVIDKQPCILSLAGDEDWHFTVINKNTSQTITFLAIDRCLVNVTIRSCDCIIFNEKEFCFVEIKNTSQRKRSNASTAIRQLEHTIELFRSIDFTKYTLEAYASFKNKWVSPKTFTGFNTAKVRFLEKYQVTLYDNNEKTF